MTPERCEWCGRTTCPLLVNAIPHWNDEYRDCAIHAGQRALTAEARIAAALTLIASEREYAGRGINAMLDAIERKLTKETP